MRFAGVIGKAKSLWKCVVWDIRKVGFIAIFAAGLVLFGTACDNNGPSATMQSINGAQIYQENCASCHGIKGEGQPGWLVPRPDGSYAAPPHDKTGHTWHHSDGLLFRITKDGGASLNIPNFSSGMPAFGQQLEDEEIRAVINHLKTFWEPGQVEGQALASENDPFPE